MDAWNRIWLIWKMATQSRRIMSRLSCPINTNRLRQAFYRCPKHNCMPFLSSVDPDQDERFITHVSLSIWYPNPLKPGHPKCRGFHRMKNPRVLPNATWIAFIWARPSITCLPRSNGSNGPISRSTCTRKVRFVLNLNDSNIMVFIQLCLTLCWTILPCQQNSRRYSFSLAFVVFNMHCA